MQNKYYSLLKHENVVDITIYGDIASEEWYNEESDVSSYKLSKELEKLENVDRINVYINSYGGEVAEGLAIYNALKRHPAKVYTYNDGFAASIASVIFMAGDERIVSPASVIMIHNASLMVVGNAEDLRKQANDLDIITQASINAYMENVNISQDLLKKLMDEETWLSPERALEYGFATTIAMDNTSSRASQNTKKKLMNMILENQVKEKETIEQKNKEKEEYKSSLFMDFFSKLGGKND